jgi:parallel beta-helix repeat protein
MEAKKYRARVVVGVLAFAVLAAFTLIGYAGNLDPPGPPGPTMKTLDEVEPMTPVQSLAGSGSAQHVINQPGSYYLTGNITVGTPGIDGIQVDCNDVTIDLRGFALLGPGKDPFGYGCGIHVNSAYNVAVMNGTVRDFKEYGVLLDGAGGNHLLRDLRASDNRQGGIKADIPTTIINCTASKNLLDGIHAVSSTLTNCTAVSNGNRGFMAQKSSVLNCTANDNGNAGFQVPSSTLINSVANGNKSIAGIYATGEGTVIKNCAANSNTEAHGIRLAASSMAIGCTALRNQIDGIYADDRSSVINCVANYNSSDGIQADSRCHIEGNHLRNNGDYGLNLVAGWTYAVRNVASDNTDGNFYSGGTNHMPIDGDNANHSFF